MAKEITAKQLNDYIINLTVYQQADLERYIDSLKSQLKQMNQANEDSSNPPGTVPPPPTH